MRFANFNFGNGGPVNDDSVSAGESNDDLLMVDEQDFVMADDFDSDEIEDSESVNNADDEGSETVDSVDEDDETFMGGSVVAGDKGEGNSYVSEPVNPFLLDVVDEEEEFVSKRLSNDFDESFDSAGESVVDDSVVGDSEVSDNDDVDDVFMGGSEVPVFGGVNDVVDDGVSVSDVSAGNVFSGSGGESVIVERRGPRAVESGFKRRNVSEVVVGKGNSGVSSGEKKRYSYVRENGRLNGAELEFFKNLGVGRNDVESDRVKRLRGRVDGLDSPSARKARNILYAQAVGGSDLLRRGSGVRFTEKDRDVLQFLALFRYAKDFHIAQVLHCAVGTARNRLKRLRSQGLVLDRKIVGTSPIWFVTEAGMLLSGYDVSRVTESKLKMNMFAHQFTVNHVASHVWGGGVNVLELDDFPVRNRVNEKGVHVLGERLLSELEIQSALGRMRGFEKAEVFSPELRAAVDGAFDRWERSGGVEFGLSPEFEFGNEFMWALLPPRSLSKAYHVPDLVVKRPRNADGSPESIAVEIEVSNKKRDAYERTLSAYKFDDRLFKKVVWVCKTRGTALKLEQAAREVGLWQDGRISIVPVLTAEGVFTGRDLWLL